MVGGRDINCCECSNVVEDGKGTSLALGILYLLLTGLWCTSGLEYTEGDRSAVGSGLDRKIGESEVRRPSRSSPAWEEELLAVAITIINCK